jgi:hypothetical protein
MVSPLLKELLALNHLCLSNHLSTALPSP